ncbi:hypothetical protein [Sinosporangium siamense]|uniref:Uncharacterized protein n=1 Tax=Sinosporangium siamense TaxID=1367973 RepID=A0A919RIV9_9ACTN|nr:hypothetical protein [Sinosporangium siamense]GII93179.1 hypothetical protein Ssi02_34100 [Sinosporangium siamense]
MSPSPAFRLSRATIGSGLLKLVMPARRREIRRRVAPPVAMFLVLGTFLGCGVQPTDPVERGVAPVIVAEPRLITIYLLRGGRLVPVPVYVQSTAIEDVMATLFEVGEQPPGEKLTSALDGLTHRESKLSRYGAFVRNDPDVASGLRLHVSVGGVRPLTRTALAQITCTARGVRDEIWVVRITQVDRGKSRSLGEHICGAFHDLAQPGTELPP